MKKRDVNILVSGVSIGIVATLIFIYIVYGGYIINFTDDNSKEDIGSAFVSVSYYDADTGKQQAELTVLENSEKYDLLIVTSEESGITEKIMEPKSNDTININGLKEDERLTIELYSKDYITMKSVP